MKRVESAGRGTPIAGGAGGASTSVTASQLPPAAPNAEDPDDEAHAARCGRAECGVAGSAPLCCACNGAITDAAAGALPLGGDAERGAACTACGARIAAARIRRKRTAAMHAVQTQPQRHPERKSVAMT